jgi:hypothetical protein
MFNVQGLFNVELLILFCQPIETRHSDGLAGGGDEESHELAYCIAIAGFRTFTLHLT